MILHHYPTSPFAEKIRLIFGHKRIEWQEVIIPMVMPKPELMPLTGGYRKTPVLQIGADVYCDTALICDVLEHLAPTPTLFPENVKGAARIVAQVEGRAQTCERWLPLWWALPWPCSSQRRD